MFKITTGEDTETTRDRRWAAWIRLVGKGDIDALGALYDESAPVIFGLVLRILGDRQLAEDAVVVIYNHVRKHTGKFDSRSQTALDWLITLARNLAVERVNRTSVPRCVKSIEDDSFRKKRHLANLALAQLPEEQRCILEMTYLGGLTVNEVANLLETSRAYAARQIVFGMRTLRKLSRSLRRSTVRISNFDLELLHGELRKGEG